MVVWTLEACGIVCFPESNQALILASYIINITRVNKVFEFEMFYY